MADEDTTATPAQVETAVASAAAEAVKVAQADTGNKEEIAALKASISALTDTVRAAMTPRQAAQPNQPATPGQLPAHFRNLLRQQGLTDADIDANAPIVVPFLTAMLSTDGQVMLGGIQQVRDEVDMVKAARNSKKFPYWNEVEEKIETLREEAQKAGQYLTPADAYKAAVAIDVQDNNSRIEAAKARAKEAKAASDASVQDLGTHHGSRSASTRTARSAEDVAQMSREERKKFFESIGDRPIG